MEHRVELTFTEIERVHLLGKDVAAAHIFFTDAGGQKYALLMGIGGTLWRFWKLGEQADEAVEKIVFQAAEEYIDEMIWKDKLQEMILKTPFHEKVYGMDDKDPGRCPYDPKQSLPGFPFKRIFWRRQGGNPVELRQEERIQFLLRLYELCAGNIGPSYNSKEIARELDIGMDNVISICVFLSKEGFINLTMDGSVSITHEGIKKAEAYQKEYRQLQSGRMESGNQIQTTRPRFFGEYKVPIMEPFVFVIMPFNEKVVPLEVFKTIRAAASTVDIECQRVDYDLFSHPITDKIYAYTKGAKVVVADLTSRNANVFYELGIAHNLDKDVIIITQSRDDVPFDLKDFPYVLYGSNDMGRLKDEIEERLRLYLGNKTGS